MGDNLETQYRREITDCHATLLARGVNADLRESVEFALISAASLATKTILDNTSHPLVTQVMENVPFRELPIAYLITATGIIISLVKLIQANRKFL